MISGLHEIIVYVDDMATQLAFYRDTLGLDLAEPVDGDPAEVDWVTFETGQCTLCLHSGGVDAEIEGSPEIVFSVDDVDAVRQTLIDRGVEVGEPREVGDHVRVAGARDPEGHPFSIESSLE